MRKIVFLLLLALPVITCAQYNVQENRELWHQRTQGENLVLGKTLMYRPDPVYTLTKDDDDVKQLTDGQISKSQNDKIWFDRSAVGWMWINSPVFIKIDLGSVQEIDRVVIRLLGGSAEWRFKFPTRFEVFASKDNVSFYRTLSMNKLTMAEKNQSDFRHFYYLDEPGGQYDTYMYPFELPVEADARYLILKMTTEVGTLFSDELAVMKAERKSAAYNQVYNQPVVEVPMESLVVNTVPGRLDIYRGFPLPQSFLIEDMRDEAEKKKHPLKDSVMILELPEGVEIASPELTGRKIQVENQPYTRYELKFNAQGTDIDPAFIFLRSDAREIAAPARAYGLCGGTAQHVSRFPVKVQEWDIPEIPAFKEFNISLAWMMEHDALRWPDYHQAWRKLGFNAVSAFPRYWANNPRNREFIKASRTAGFSIVMNESTFFQLTRSPKPGSEFLCGNSKDQICPSYQGKLYQEEIARIRRDVENTQPDYVFTDIEYSKQYTSNCPRCLAAAEKAGKPLKEYLLDRGTEINRDIYRAIHAAMPEKPPLVGSYHRQPVQPLFWVEDFFRIYPDYLDISQPSLYVGGNIATIHHNIRDNYRLLKKRHIIPWLTAGTYGRFPADKMEPMVLESMLNGASGITYYRFNDFALVPAAFYYHAKALALLRPFEPLAMNGEILTLQGSNPQHYYSAVKKDGEMLLLVGNYDKAQETTSISLPFKKVLEIKDIRNRGTFELQGNTLTVNVPKDRIRLFHIRGEN